jgi:hypothetical protein
MDGISVSLQIVIVMVVLGAVVETFYPGILTQHMKDSFSALTMAMIGILCSFLLLMWLLKLGIREGFEEKSYETRWKDIAESNKVEEVCKIYTEIYEKMLAVEKGAPPAPTKTDAQAREAVNQRFSGLMSVPPVSCSLIDELQAKVNTLDTFYPTIQSAPDNLLVQVYQTASACLALLIENYNQIQDAERRRTEGFEDLCTDAEADERRKYIQRNTLSDEAKRCVLPEEVPKEKKLSVIDEKLNQMERALETYTKEKSIKASIAKVLDDCKYYKAELDKKKEEIQNISKNTRVK